MVVNAYICVCMYYNNFKVENFNSKSCLLFKTLINNNNNDIMIIH